MNFLSKVVIFLADPMLWLIALVVGGLVCWRLGAKRWARGAGWVAAGLAVFLMLVPAGPWAIQALEDRFPRPAELPEEVAGIVVLGGAIEPAMSRRRGEVALNANAERVFAFVALARRYPDTPLIYTGGTGNPFDQSDREADIAPRLFRELGLDPARIAFERESRNTHENALLSRDLAGDAMGGQWILITSARHMPRAVGSFRAAGWRVIPYPVDYLTGPELPLWNRLDLVAGAASLREALREWLGLAGYRLLGRTDSLFPGPRGSE